MFRRLYYYNFIIEQEVNMAAYLSSYVCSGILEPAVRRCECISSLVEIEIGVLYRRFLGQRDLFVIEDYPFAILFHVTDIMATSCILSDVGDPVI